MEVWALLYSAKVTELSSDTEKLYEIEMAALHKIGA